ncbi:frataxin-like iron-binding protein CyaY [Dysgonomonas sp. PFB1-18]|uniref:hypothetical protein n=1 Tax=unclassified Dysgonomonas TaxID=2630389 RepID=UPI0024735823|nr:MULTISPECIES: hypothetical protein [unclassified Dysgonomonas]MDH6310894.1 frataxin-like iron-binding protein CyaY [Dysgonomonas sp. PF1-14]MDH6341037.1 frataxin-like iron-binding protein CyaY [Dysgonomonas sp. PF1-16]MDH6382720.1 frataxin-like iron-binding protein CyaY [Dysgonomonas sp. PFB1-18]MDH6400017.1 frataxin-like iron-binding protein CyaY [Dysgonomonas sp. PF1-23]
MNICTNIAVVSSTDKKIVESILQDIDENFECYTDIETNNNVCELEFSSRGQFSENIMSEITGKHQGNNLYMQVLTYDLSDELVEYHIYENGRWVDKLAEKYQYKR